MAAVVPVTDVQSTDIIKLEINSRKPTLRLMENGKKEEMRKTEIHTKLTTCAIESMRQENGFLSCGISKKDKHNCATVNVFSKTQKNGNGNI